MESRTEKQKRLARKMSLALDPELTAERQHARHLTRLDNQTTQEEAERRMQLLKALFGAVGVDPVIEPPFHGDSGDNIFIGDGFFMNLGGIILDAAEVRIGANVVCGSNVKLGAVSHPIDPELPLSVDGSMALAAPITIGDRVSYGDGVLISVGVRIGDNNYYRCRQHGHPRHPQPCHRCWSSLQSHTNATLTSMLPNAQIVCAGETT